MIPLTSGDGSSNEDELWYWVLIIIASIGLNYLRGNSTWPELADTRRTTVRGTTTGFCMCLSFAIGGHSWSCGMILLVLLYLPRSQIVWCEEKRRAGDTRTDQGCPSLSLPPSRKDLLVVRGSERYGSICSPLGWLQVSARL
jgi:hypothetical protein